MTNEGRMSKSLKRVEKALESAGLSGRVIEAPSETRTAAQAACAAGCEIDQIAKSILFMGAESAGLWLFVTAGGRQVCPQRAAQLAGEALLPCDAATIRSITGFAIGGVAPLGHLTPARGFIDEALMDFPQVWAAAGTPRHIFSVTPAELLAASGLSRADFSLPPQE